MLDILLRPYGFLAPRVFKLLDFPIVVNLERIAYRFEYVYVNFLSKSVNTCTHDLISILTQSFVG